MRRRRMGLGSGPEHVARTLHLVSVAKGSRCKSHFRIGGTGGGGRGIQHGEKGCRAWHRPWMDGKGEVLFHCSVSGLGWMQPRGQAQVRPSYGTVPVFFSYSFCLPEGRRRSAGSEAGNLGYVSLLDLLFTAVTPLSVGRWAARSRHPPSAIRAVISTGLRPLCPNPGCAPSFGSR